MDPISIALGLAQVAPSILRFLGVGEKNVTVAEKAIDIAKDITGAVTGEDALNILNVNSEKALDFRIAIVQNEQELNLAYLADMKSARDRDKAFIETGTRNWRADFMFGLAVLMIAGIAAAIWNTPSIDEYTKGIATLILGRFLGYLDNIYNFEFGSTRSGRSKDASIQALTKKD